MGKSPVVHTSMCEPCFDEITGHICCAMSRSTSVHCMAGYTCATVYNVGKRQVCKQKGVFVYWADECSHH